MRARGGLYRRRQVIVVLSGFCSNRGDPRTHGRRGFGGAKKCAAPGPENQAFRDSTADFGTKGRFGRLGEVWPQMIDLMRPAMESPPKSSKRTRRKVAGGYSIGLVKTDQLDRQILLPFEM